MDTDHGHFYNYRGQAAAMSSPIAGVQPMTDRTITQLNIDHFTRLLTTNLDRATRQTVEQLLAEAKADLHAGQNRSVAASPMLCREPMACCLVGSTLAAAT